MRFASTILALAATCFLAACGEDECTQEAAQKKATDLATKLQELVATDPAKLAELSPKLQDLATKAAAGGDDLQAACKAMDEMMTELSK